MYFVAFQLRAPRAEYDNLFNALQALGPWSNRLSDCWLGHSRYPARRIRDLLKVHLTPGDRLFVGQFSRNWSASNMGDGFPEWMGRRAFEPTELDGMVGQKPDGQGPQQA